MPVRIPRPGLDDRCGFTAVRKAKPGDRDPGAKRGASPGEVDKYLADVPEPARGTLNTIRAVIRSVVPEATEVISYRMPTFKYKGRPLLELPRSRTIAVCTR